SSCMISVFSGSVVCAAAAPARKKSPARAAPAVRKKCMSGSLACDRGDAAAVSLQIADLITLAVLFGSQHAQRRDQAKGLVVGGVDGKLALVGEGAGDGDGRAAVLRQARPQLLAVGDAQPKRLLHRRA